MLDIRQAIVYRIAKKWIAGKDMDSAINYALKANKRKVNAIINYLGEDINDEQRVNKSLNEYLSLQKAIKDSNVRGCASVKLTQIGLLLSEELARKNVEKIAENAMNLGQKLWIDMESSKFTESTITIYTDLVGSYKNLGVAIQAYLKRSNQDVEKIINKNGMIRIVKGAYKEEPTIVYTRKARIRENFVKIMNRLFESGTYFAVATHDSYLIERAKELSKDHDGRFEFEFLKGIRDDIKFMLAEEYNVSEYIPYGEEWYKYSMRRISEHPSNIVLLLRSLI